MACSWAADAAAAATVAATFVRLDEKPPDVADVRLELIVDELLDGFRVFIGFIT